MKEICRGMFQKVTKKVRECRGHIYMMIALVEACALSNQTAMCLAATAASVNSVLKPLTTLKTLILSAVALIGVILLVKEVSEFATAYKQSDSTAMISAIKGMVGAFLMAGISGVIALLGFK